MRVEKIIKLTTITVVIFIIFGVIAQVYKVPYVEATTLKEYDTSRSKGNCRIVNPVIALENDYDLLFINFITKREYTHVISIDKEGTLYDVSRGENLKSNESLEHYLEKNDAYIYGRVTEARSLNEYSFNYEEKHATYSDLVMFYTANFFYQSIFRSVFLSKTF